MGCLYQDTKAKTWWNTCPWMLKTCRLWYHQHSSDVKFQKTQGNKKNKQGKIRGSSFHHKYKQENCTTQTVFRISADLHCMLIPADVPHDQFTRQFKRMQLKLWLISQKSIWLDFSCSLFSDISVFLRRGFWFRHIIRLEGRDQLWTHLGAVRAPPVYHALTLQHSHK